MSNVVEFKRPGKPAEPIDPASAIKKALLQAALSVGGVSVMVDPAVPGTDPGPFAVGENKLVFKLGLSNNPVPELAGLGVKAVLSAARFGGQPIPVVLPWKSIIAVWDAGTGGTVFSATFGLPQDAA